MSATARSRFSPYWITLSKPWQHLPVLVVSLFIEGHLDTSTAGQCDGQPLSPFPLIPTLDPTKFLHQSHCGIRSLEEGVLLANTNTRTTVEPITCN